MRDRCRYPGSSKLIPGFIILILISLQTVLSAEENPNKENSEENVQQIEIRDTREKAKQTAPSAQSTVITREEIMASAPSSLSELIAPVLGVQVYRHGGIDAGSFVSIRGASPEQVLVLVDGKRINSSQGGGTDLSIINIDNIERIEIYRGGQSSIFGENAIGGAINIITRKPEKDRISSETALSVGSFRTVKADTSLSGTDKESNIDFALHLGAFHSAGAYSYEDTQLDEESTRENADSDKFDVSARLGLKPFGKFDADISTSAYTRDRGVPGILEFPTNTARMQDRHISGDLTVETNTGNADISAETSVSYTMQEYRDPEYFLGSIDESHENISVSTGVSTGAYFPFFSYILTPVIKFTYRYDVIHSSALLDSTGVADNSGSAYRNQGSGSLSVSIEPEESELYIPRLYPSIRYDINSVFHDDSETIQTPLSWSFGTAIPLLKKNRLMLKGNISRSHRVPSFNDLFWSSTAFAVGNPGLKIEEGLLWDAGISGNILDWLKIEAVYFHHNVDNLILWTPGAGGRWRPDNIGSAELSGVEAEARTLFDIPAIQSMLETSANTTLLSPIDTTKGSVSYGNILPRRAQTVIGSQITLSHYNGHSLKTELQYVGPRYSTAANTKIINEYFLVNAALTMLIKDNWKLIISGQNLLNSSFVDVREFPVPGFTFDIETRLEF